MNSKTRATFFTMLINILQSGFAMVFSLVYTNLLIERYGSEVNGLISTIIQFVSLFSIIEGGFTTVAVVATYKPIVTRDYVKLNNVLYTTKIIFYRIGLIIVVAVTILGAIYLKIIDSPLSYSQSLILLLISTLTTATSMFGLLKYTVFLNGNNQEYIITFFALIARTITWIFSIVLILTNQDIILVFSMTLANVLVNLIIIRIYEKYKYPYVKYEGDFDNSLLKGTKDLLAQKIANTIFTSTDLILISAYISLAAASVFNIYNQIFRAIFNLLSSVIQGPFNSFGQIASEKNTEKLNKVFKVYQIFTTITSTTLFTITSCTILSFIRLFSRNISDYNYIYSSLVLLFLGQYFTQAINRPFGIILNATGNFSAQNKQCIIGAIIKIIISYIFIPLLGINSIILGSFIATAFILESNIYQTYKLIVDGSIKKTNVWIGLNLLVAILITFTSINLDFSFESYFLWFIYLIIVSVISFLLVCLLNYIINKQDFNTMIQYLWTFAKSKKKHK